MIKSAICEVLVVHVPGPSYIFRFEDFQFDLRAGELRRDGQTPVQLPEQLFLILSILLENAGQLVTREEIRNRLWPNGTVVEYEHSISAAMNRLRQTLGDSSDNPRFIETLARRGYRWKLAVQRIQAEPAKAITTHVTRTGTLFGNLIGKKVSHYRVLDVLGGGGMGVVYKAEDLRLGRRVALKFLPEELVSASDALERFEREARAASALSHPNICTIYEIEDHEEQPFIVMELLEGQTLRELVSSASDHKEELSFEMALTLAIQIGQGLEAAHQNGVVHRDIKPANIFITRQSQAKILDFGLAKLAPNFVDTAISRSEDPQPPDIETSANSRQELFHSRAGLAMGTAGYMSPEQVRGEQVDARTDIFSFGLVLYEMATGRRAFSGGTAAALHDSILNSDAPPLREINPSLPSAFEAIVSRALQKDRDRRYQSSAEMLVDLKRIKGTSGASTEMKSLPTPPGKESPRPRWSWITAGGVAFLALVIWLSINYLGHNQSSRLTEQDTIVLADFANSTGDSIFDETLKPALVSALRESPFLNILSSAKVREALTNLARQPNTPLTPDVARDVCQRAGGKAYITGAIGPLGNEYAVVLKAVNCQNAEILAQEQVTAADKDMVLDALSKSTAKLRSRLGESLASVERFDYPADETTGSLEALRAYNQGYKAGAQKGPAAELAYDLQAIQLDPNFAIAYLGAGEDYLNDGQSARAAEYITKAFELRNHTGERERQEITSVYYLTVTGELEKAAQAYENTIQSYPRSPTAYHGVGIVYAELGQHEKAAAMHREVVRQVPDNSLGYENLSENLLSLQRLEESRQSMQAEQARKLDTYDLHTDLYALAFITGDSASMAEQLDWLANKPEVADLGIYLQADSEAYAGRLRKARELTHQVINGAAKTDDKEGAAKTWVNSAMREAMFGNRVEARRAAYESLKLAPGNQRVEIEAALALAMSGDVPHAESLVGDLKLRFPLHTQVQFIWLPGIEGQLALARKTPDIAVVRLQSALPFELGYTPTHANISCLYPVYVRGQAYLALGESASAAKEFQKILDHSGIVWNCPTGALARLGLARANALQSRTSEGVEADAARARAHAAYRDFLTLWKDADPDIPVLKEAKLEAEKLP